MVNVIKKYRSFAGSQIVYSYNSAYLNSLTEFAVYIPEKNIKAVLIYLSGLTCTWENVMAKSGIQKIASENGIAIIAPDTSPRGQLVKDNDKINLGQGAGFYLNATQEPWSKHYHMYDFIVKELPNLSETLLGFPCKKFGLMGHSMGGHGALTIGIRNPELFPSVSAFSPICNPVATDWGQLAFKTYLGDNKEDWVQYDTCELLGSVGYKGELLVDQGSDDEFLHNQLRPDILAKTCRDHGIQLELNMRANYDHSYYFVSSFLESHVQWHLKNL